MKKLILAAAALAALAALSSCAKRPDAIVPVDIPMAVYQGQSCQQLGNELVKEQQNLSVDRRKRWQTGIKSLKSYSESSKSIAI